MSDPYASLPDDHDEPDHWVLDLPDDQFAIAGDFYRDVPPLNEVTDTIYYRDRPLRLRPFGVFDEVPGMRTLN